ncbi:MAG: dihydrolipoamide succinyltransferase, partial [Methylovulum sp.]
MSIEVRVPNLPESVSDATVVAWHKQAGDNVSKNESLVDLETDKVVLEVTAPESGIVSQILTADGAVVTGGELMALIEAGAVNAQAPTGTQEAKPSDTPLSPSVRRLINENTLNPAEITGTGKSGRLTKT